MAGFHCLILEHEPFFDPFHAVTVYININRDDLLSGPGFDFQLGEGEFGDINDVAISKYLMKQFAIVRSGDDPFQPLMAGKQGAVVKSVCAALTCSRFTAFGEPQPFCGQGETGKPHDRHCSYIGPTLCLPG